MSQDTDQDIFAQAMADEPVEEQVPASEQVQEQQPDIAGQPRDESGRFAAKADEGEQAEGDAQSEPAPEAVQPSEAKEPQGHIPPGRLREEAEKRRSAEQELSQNRQEMQALQRQIIDMQNRMAQVSTPKAEQTPPPELWDDPNGWLQHSVGNVLNPIQQQLKDMGEKLSKAQAQTIFGVEAVDKAFSAIKEAIEVKRDPAAIEAHRQMAESDDPYGRLVQWHKRQSVLSTVGDDPNAWLEAELEKRIADPAFQAKVIERARNTAPARTPSGQVTSPPPSLGRVPGSGNQSEQFDTSDAGIFADAMNGR